MDGNNDIDLTWAHPSLAKCARRIFRKVRRDGEGRLRVEDMRRSFGRHADPMLDVSVEHGGGSWAFLDPSWKSVLKDWGVCAGVSMWCIKEG